MFVLQALKRSGRCQTSCKLLRSGHFRFVTQRQASGHFRFVTQRQQASGHFRFITQTDKQVATFMLPYKPFKGLISCLSCRCTVLIEGGSAELDTKQEKKKRKRSCKK